MLLINIVIDKETPKDNNSANIISLNNPMAAISPLEDIANIQNTMRKMAGVRTSACCICGMCFFIYVMGSLIKGKGKASLLRGQLPLIQLDLLE